MQYCAFRTNSLHFQTKPLEGPSIFVNSPVPSSVTEHGNCKRSQNGSSKTLSINSELLHRK